MRDPDEVFRFIWENRRALGLSDGAYTRVLSVRPCLRIAPDDGFPLRETVAECMQQIKIEAGRLKSLGIEKPEEMPDEQEVSLDGGMTLIFDEYGRVEIRRGETAARRVRSRRCRRGSRGGSPISGDFGYYRKGASLARRFSAMHRQRALGVTLRACGGVVDGATRKPTSVTIRSYQVGFGDCFLRLVQLRRGRQGRAPARSHRLRQHRPAEAKGGFSLDAVAKDIKEKSGGKLTAVVATHRHRDHISGFGGKTGKRDRRSQARCRRAAVDRGSEGAAGRDRADGRAEGREGVRRRAGRHARRRAVFAAGGRRASRAEDGKGTDCVSRRRQPRESRRGQDADGA